MSQPKIAIIGFGYVGRAFARMINGHADIIVYSPHIDNSKLREEGLTLHIADKNFQYINDCDLAVICVPTPTDPDTGECDTSIVEESIQKLTIPILIKSTIEPGTTDRLIKKYKKSIVFSPEYVGEGKYAITDPKKDFQTNMKNTPFLILGGDKKACAHVFDLLVPILGPEKIYYHCSAKEAEVIKYMENTYFGIKVTFANEMYEVCKALDVDWYKVWQGWALDPRVDASHTAVFTNARGFSGKCLPKDLNALVAASDKAGYYPEFLAEMIKSNSRFNPEEPPRYKGIK